MWPHGTEAQGPTSHFLGLQQGLATPRGGGPRSGEAAQGNAGLVASPHSPARLRGHHSGGI